MDLTMSSFSFTLKIFLDILYFNFMTYCNHLMTLLVCYTGFLCMKTKEDFWKKCFFSSISAFISTATELSSYLTCLDLFCSSVYPISCPVTAGKGSGYPQVKELDKSKKMDGWKVKAWSLAGVK